MSSRNLKLQLCFVVPNFCNLWREMLLSPTILSLWDRIKLFLVGFLWSYLFLSYLGWQISPHQLRYGRICPHYSHWTWLCEFYFSVKILVCEKRGDVYGIIYSSCLKVVERSHRGKRNCEGIRNCSHCHRQIEARVRVLCHFTYYSLWSGHDICRSSSNPHGSKDGWIGNWAQFHDFSQCRNHL